MAEGPTINRHRNDSTRYKGDIQINVTEIGQTLNRDKYKYCKNSRG